MVVVESGRPDGVDRMAGADPACDDLCNSFFRDGKFSLSGRADSGQQVELRAAFAFLFAFRLSSAGIFACGEGGIFSCSITLIPSRWRKE